MTTKPQLLLLPNLLSDVAHHEPYLPSSVDRAVATIDGLIAESETGARRFLSRFETKVEKIRLPVSFLNKRTPPEDYDFLLEPIRRGERWGLISDAGLPCIGDPGAGLVLRARQSGISVQAFPGPCSFLHALVLSGLPAQEFIFHGYLPKEGDQLKRQIREMERVKKTQIFMERAYRNKQLLELLLATLQPETYLSVAWELMSPDQGVVTQPVSLWNKNPLPNLDKRNAVFLISP